MPIIRLLIFILAMSSVAEARELLELSPSVKALGMGNAYTGHSKGHDAIFYNPAGLASLKDFQWRIMGMTAGLNGIDVYDEYADIFDNSDDLAATLNALYGRPIWLRTDFQTSISLGPFIVGAFARANAGFTLLNPALPNLEANYYSDYGFFGGAGFELVPQYLDVGAIVKRVTRIAGGQGISASTLVYLDSDLIENTTQQTGVAYGADFGMKLKFPSSWNPSIAFAWQDIGDTKFSMSPSTPPPASIKDRMNIALGLEGGFDYFKIRPAIEFKSVNESASDIQLGKRIHAGLEIELPAITLRGGFNQGYYTAGASFDFWIFQMDLVTYGVELGEYVGQNEDRRYMLQLTADIGIDKSTGQMFNMSKSRRRGLKQRR